MAGYGAAKAYILALGDSLHEEAKDLGVDVSVLSPGPTDTPMAAAAGIDFGSMGMAVMKPEEVARTELAALGKRADAVPGFRNRVMAFIMTRLMPRAAADSSAQLLHRPASVGRNVVDAIESEDTTDCLKLTALEGPQSLVNVDNQCMETFSLVSATCSEIECMMQSELQIEPEATRQISSFDIGLFGNELQAGDGIEVELGWSLGTDASGTIALALTYEGYTGGEHDFDDGTGGTGDGSKGDPGCGGCSSTNGTPGALVAVLMLVVLGIRRRA